VLLGANFGKIRPVFHRNCSPALLAAPEEKSGAFIQSGLVNKVCRSWQNATPHSSKTLVTKLDSSENPFTKFPFRGFRGKRLQRIARLTFIIASGLAFQTLFCFSHLPFSFSHYPFYPQPFSITLPSNFEL
jgi:hypothetical protein